MEMFNDHHYQPFWLSVQSGQVNVGRGPECEEASVFLTASLGGQGNLPLASSR